MTEAERDASGAMDGFSAALNVHDEDTVRHRRLRLPHLRHHSGKVTVCETPADFTSLVIRMAGQARQWARSDRDCAECVDAGPQKVRFRVQFSRRRADGPRRPQVVPCRDRQGWPLGRPGRSSRAE